MSDYNDVGEKLSALFSQSQNPILGISNNEIVFCSQSAVMAFEGMSTGAKASKYIPEHVLMQDADHFVCSADICKKPVTITAARFGDEKFLILSITLAKESVKQEGIVPEALVSSLRSSAFTMRLAADQIISHIDDDSGSNDPYSAMLYHSYFNILRLTNNMDTANKLAMGTLDFTPRTRELVALCEDLVNTTNHFISDTGIKLIFECPKPKIFARVDGNKIEQLLLNLITNSIKNTPSGGTVKLTLKPSGERVIITVEDSGEGIPPDIMSGIFRRFEERIPLNELAQGTGLGLGIAKGIAELHGGVLIIESRNGKGSTVAVMLPTNTMETNSVHEGVPEIKDINLILRELVTVLDSDHYSKQYLD